MLDTRRVRAAGTRRSATSESPTHNGTHKRGVSMITSTMLGSFRDDARTRAEFLDFIAVRGAR